MVNTGEKPRALYLVYEGKLCQYADKWSTTAILPSPIVARSLLNVTESINLDKCQLDSEKNKIPSIYALTSDQNSSHIQLMRQDTGLSRQYSIELSMQVNPNVKMTFDSQKSVNMDELIGRLFRKRKGISAKRGGVLLRKKSKEITDYDRELLMDDRTVYRMERRRKLNLVEDKEDAEYTNKLREFKQSKVKEYNKWSLIGEQELYYNIASQKMAIANQESWILFIPLSFYTQIFSKFSKNLYSSVNKSLLVKNRLFGDAKLSLDLIAKL